MTAVLELLLPIKNAASKILLGSHTSEVSPETPLGRVSIDNFYLLFPGDTHVHDVITDGSAHTLRTYPSFVAEILLVALFVLSIFTAFLDSVLFSFLLFSGFLLFFHLSAAVWHYRAYNQLKP